MRSKLPTWITRPVIAVGLGGLVALLVPIWFVHLAISRVRTARRRPTPVMIPRVDIADVRLDDIIAARTPVILRDLIDSLGLDVVPDVAGLTRIAAQTDDSFTVTSHRDHSPFFLYRGDYGAEIEQVRDMRLHEFLAVMFDRDQAAGTCTYKLFNVRELGGRVGSVIDDISTKIAGMTASTPDRTASGIWIGSTGVVTPLHHDAWTGLLFQFAGAKRVLMFAPGDRPNLYFTSPFSPRNVWSRLPGRSTEAEPTEFPRYARATRHEAQLEAGEVLFIPPFWAHEIEALEANVSVPFRFRTSRRDHLDPGFLMPAYEVFHQKYLHDRSVST